MKAHLLKSTRFIFTCGKSLYSQLEWRTALSRVEVYPINDSVKAFPSQSQSCIVYIRKALQIWGLFSGASSKFFLRKWRRRGKALDLCRLVAL